MKMHSFTSLFLFFILGYPILGLPNSVHAQTKTDSASYYYQTIIDQKDADEIGAAISFYEKRIAAYEATHDLMDAVQGLRLITIGQYHLGYLFESEATATKALAYLEKLPDSKLTTEAEKALYMHLGQVYRTLSNTKTAIYYYNKALELATNTYDSIVVFNNRANVQADAKNYTLAVKDLEAVYAITMKGGDSLRIAKAKDNLGFVQSKLGLTEGLLHMNEALAIRLKKKDLTGIYSSYRHLTEFYIDHNNTEQAEAYAQKAYNVASSLNSASYLENALTYVLKARNDPMFTQYLTLTDSISKAKLAQENKHSGIKFNFEKEARRANANQLEKEKAKRYTLLYQGIGGLVLLSGIFLYFLLRDKHRKEKLKEIYRTETRISKKVHDEVANDVYHVMSKLQNKASDQDEVLDDLEDIYERTRDISKEHGIIDLQDNFDTILSDLLLSYQNPDTSIITRNISKIDWDHISDIKKTTLYRVLQELMTNMKKHSHATLVAVVFSHSNNKLKIEYTDNGIGCDLKKKNGLLNTENRIETIKGSISFESQEHKGFKAIITI